MAKAKNAKQKVELTAEERSAEMRRRIALRWAKADPLRNKPTKDAIELVRLACEMGATKKRICEVLDISETKFDKFIQDPAFAAAVKGGKQYEHDSLVNKLVEIALKGNVAAICFALKTRHNFNDQGSGNAVIENKVSVNFVLPDALPAEQYLKSLTANATIITPRDAVAALAQPGVKGKVLKQLSIERAEENHNGEK